MKQSNKHKRPGNSTTEPPDDEAPEYDSAAPEQPEPQLAEQEDEAPTPLSARERRMQREAARNGGDAKESKEEPKDSKSDKDPPLSEQSSTQLKKKLLSYTEEFHMLAGEEGTAAVNRRVELRRLMRGVQDVIDAREPLVEVTIPRSVTGEPFQIGERQFYPGIYHVRSSIAQYLLWMIDKNQRVEMDRLRSNGRTIDLGTIGSRARMAKIARDEGGDHF